MGVRDSPCSERDSRSSSGRLTVMTPSSSDTVIGSAMVTDSSPFGPLTATSWPSTLTSTPLGTEIGIMTKRDMVFTPSLPDEREDFPTHTLLADLTTGTQAERAQQEDDADGT